MVRPVRAYLVGSVTETVGAVTVPVADLFVEAVAAVLQAATRSEAIVAHTRAHSPRRGGATPVTSAQPRCTPSQPRSATLPPKPEPGGHVVRAAGRRTPYHATVPQGRTSRVSNQEPWGQMT